MHVDAPATGNSDSRDRMSPNSGVRPAVAAVGTLLASVGRPAAVPIATSVSSLPAGTALTPSRGGNSLAQDVANLGHVPTKSGHNVFALQLMEGKTRSRSKKDDQR